MAEDTYHIVNFIADNGQEWQNEYASFVPRVGDVVYPYEVVKGVYRVEEVWIVGENHGAVTQGTNVFVTEIPMKGSRLYNHNPRYYGDEG